MSGVISPLDDGDLVISLFALNKAAALYGVTLTGAKISWMTLAALPGALLGSARVIAHINGNHFVVITKITGSTVTYIDMGKGKDKQNESVTVSKEEFLKVWKGDVSVGVGETIVISALAQAEGYNTRFLSVEETKNIRGAFLPLLFVAAWGAIQSLGAAVWAVVNAIGTLLAAVGQIVAGAVQNIGLALTKIGEGLAYVGNGLFNAVKFAASTIGKFFANPFASAAAQAAPAGVTQVSFGHALFQTAVKVGLGVATSKGLESLGVDPVVANLAAAFVTGGIQGGFNAGFTASNFIQGGVKALALEGSQLVMQNAGIDSPLIDTLLMVASPFIDGIQSGNIGGAVVNIINDLPKLLTNYGLQKAGGALGLSPTVSQLVAAPLAVSLGSGFQNGNLFGQDLVHAVQQSVTMGAVAYGLEFAGQSDSILGSLLSTDIIKGISIAVGKSGLFDKIFDTLGRTAVNVFNVVGGAVQGVLSGITNFGQEIQQKGLAGALQHNIQSFFGRPAQEAILAKGGAQNVANLPRTQATLPNGQQGMEAKIDSDHSLYFDSQGSLIGKKEMGDIQIGTFGKNASQDKVALTDGTVYSNVDGMTVVSTIENGEAMTVRVFNETGQEVVAVDPGELNTSIKIEGPSASDSNSPTFWNSVIDLVSFGTSFTIGQGVAQAAEIGIGVTQSTLSSNQEILYALVNGIGNKETDLTTPPDYIDNLETDLVVESDGILTKGADFIKSALYQPWQFLHLGAIDLNQAKDIIRVIKEMQSVTQELVSTLKVISDFDYRFAYNLDDKYRPMVAVGYSGGFVPLAKAINIRQYNTESIVALGAATALIGGIPSSLLNSILAFIQQGSFGLALQLVQEFTGMQNSGLPDLSNSSVQFIANVYGTKDILNQVGIGGKRENLAGVNTINIEIEGATHFDYMLRGDESDPVKSEFNIKVSKFVTNLILNSDTQEKLLSFLEENLVAPDPTDGVWRFRPNA